jgi:hypothetical protein
MNVLRLDPNHKPKLPEELEHSRPLDVHKWSDFKDVNGFIDVIWDEFFSSSYPVNPKAGNRSKSKPKKQLKWRDYEVVNIDSDIQSEIVFQNHQGGLGVMDFM